MKIDQYFKELEEQVKKSYVVAEAARKKGLDPVDKVEIPLATSLAGRVAGLISAVYPQLNNPQLVNRILELEKQYGNLDPAICLIIAEEIAKEKFCKFKSLHEGIDAGIRVGMAYITLGVVSSPIEGFTEFKLGKTTDNKEYFMVYYSGPIRSAGGTGAAFSLVIADYLRETLGYAKYDPTEIEVKRMVTEMFDYHEKVNNLQYLPTEEEAIFLAKNIPVQVTGDASEQREVSNYKDVQRIETNMIRGGFCLVFAEGLAQKAPKIQRMIKKLREKGFKLTDWSFLEEYNKLHEKREKGKASESPTFIKDLVAGRPVLGHPSASGAFRLRYGRARNTGYSCLAVHPATMQMLGGFIGIGTQIKIELPTKGAAIVSCDSVEGPIVKLYNGSVRRIQDADTARNIYDDVEQILYTGDLLVPFGDFANRNHLLVPAGYTEQEWFHELKKNAKGETMSELESIYDVPFTVAKSLSKQTGIPLHPKHTFFWTQISYDDMISLLDWLAHSNIFEKKILFPYNKTESERFLKGKRALEILGIPHEVTTENVLVDTESSQALLLSLGIESDNLEQEIDKIMKIVNVQEDKKVLAIINKLAGIQIRDKAGTFIGSRMGRPEKAKLRKLVGSPNVLFPVGEEGGRLRSVNEACEKGFVKADFPLFYCETCKKETVYKRCETCKSECRRIYFCYECRTTMAGEKCKVHNQGQDYMSKKVDIKHYFNSAVKSLDLTPEEIPSLIKGVRGTSNKNHALENLAKGILRTMFKLQVNKDGTIRFDATELPLTHFKPKEVSASVAKLRELGYTKDVNGNELENDEQILEIFPHDVVLPACPVSGDEKADDVFVRIAGFVDALLIRLYGLEPFYRVKSREDLIGHLISCIAPHNCASVVGRIIGFSKSQAFVASPYMHAAMRRDCFDFNTYIPIKKNGCWKIEKIGEIVEKLNPLKKVDNYGTKEAKAEGFETLGFDKVVSETKINNFTKHAKLPMYEIKTSLGKKIQVTENHKFLVDKKIKSASELKMGDKIPLLMKINIASKKLESMNLVDFFKNEKDTVIRNIKNIVRDIDSAQLVNILHKINISKRQFSNYHLRDSYPADFVLALNDSAKKKIFENGKISFKRDRIAVPILINLEKDILEAIGLYAAEGYSRRVSGKKGLNQVYIASSEKELREFIKNTIKKHFGLIPSERKNDRVTFSSKALYLFFTKILEAGSIARDKRVPYLFLDLPLDKLGAFLRGYFEGDGSAEKNRKKVSCDSVSEGLLNDLEFCLARFGIFAKRYEYEKEPGPKVRAFYEKKRRSVPKFRITKLIIGSDFVDNFMKIGFLTQRKNKILESYKKIKAYGMKISYDSNFVYDSVASISPLGEKESYCLNVANENHLVSGNSIISRQCDGDEAGFMLLLDMLINFSREFLPAHRGGTQDAPLVLNARIRAGEVDDMIFDLDIVRELPLELYEKARAGEHPSKISIEQIKSRVGKEEFTNLWYEYETSDINHGVLCSNYKRLVTMRDKVQKQMELAEKLRAVDANDVARLVIDRHFIRDIRGNLRKFSQQEFRCSKCNQKYRRPPLLGKCLECGGNIIFTISEGSIVKYLEPALQLAQKYQVTEYLRQNLELTKSYIESIFGKEKEKQQDLKKWF